MEREGRLGLRRRVGEKARARGRRRLEAAAVRLRQARPLHRQGGLGHPVQRHLRPVGGALEDLDQRRRDPQADPPGAIEYPEERIFAPAIVMVDMQLEHATKVSLPSLRFPGEQGWYFNQGEQAGITDDWFTVAALVNAGH